jgi:hypothetical protein
MRLRRRAITLMLLLGVFAATPAYAGTSGGPRCHIEFSRVRRYGFVGTTATFFVRSPGPRGAIGVWKRDSGHRLVVRVASGEGKDQTTRGGVEKGDYQLVRCETT